MATKFRSGAIGALLDEYERALADLKKIIVLIPDQELPAIINTQTSDENCKSIQRILSHVVHSGYGYATSIQNLNGHNKQRPSKEFHSTIEAYLEDLNTVLAHTENILNEFNDQDLEQLDQSLKIKTSWGQLYDIEQLMEHAIVHVLRHRRQLDKIKLASKW